MLTQLRDGRNLAFPVTDQTSLEELLIKSPVRVTIHSPWARLRVAELTVQRGKPARPVTQSLFMLRQAQHERTTQSPFKVRPSPCCCAGYFKVSKYATRSAASWGVSGCDAMRVRGLTSCGLVIQRHRFSGVFSSSPMSSGRFVGLPMPSSAGPALPPAPPTAWQATHPLLVKSSRPTLASPSARMPGGTVGSGLREACESSGRTDGSGESQGEQAAVRNMMKAATSRTDPVAHGPRHPVSPCQSLCARPAV